MAKKIFTYRGKTIDELKSLKNKEFFSLLPARERRTAERGFTEEEKKVYQNLEKGVKTIKTHCRNVIITPKMIGLTLQIHNGKSFESIMIQPEMIGNRIGVFALTRKRLKHSSPGVGASKSNSQVSK